MLLLLVQVPSPWIVICIAILSKKIFFNCQVAEGFAFRKVSSLFLDYGNLVNEDVITKLQTATLHCYF